MNIQASIGLCLDYRKMTKSELAKQLGVSRQRVGAMTNNECPMNSDLLVRLAKVFEMRVSEFIRIGELTDE